MLDNDNAIVHVSSQQSYSEVSLNQRPELEPAGRRESAVDDDMWVTIKWHQRQEMEHQQLEKSIEEDPEAIALSLLGGGDSHHKEQIPTEDYTNLTDINTGQAFVGEVKRSEEDSNKIYIDSNTIIRDNESLSIPTHDYINHDTDDGKEEEQLKQNAPKGDTYSEVDDVDDIIKKLDEKKSQHNGSVASVPPTSDYVNTAPSPIPSKVLYRETC